MTSTAGWLARAANKPLQWQAIDTGPLGEEEVEVSVDYCGVCHSDLSIMHNEWGNAQKGCTSASASALVGPTAAACIVSHASTLISGQRDVSGSPTGAPVDIARMLAFAARHDIRPQVEHFAMSRANEAIAHLEVGKARYRVVLDAGR